MECAVGIITDHRSRLPRPEGEVLKEIFTFCFWPRYTPGPFLAGIAGLWSAYSPGIPNRHDLLLQKRNTSFLQDPDAHLAFLHFFFFLHTLQALHAFVVFWPFTALRVSRAI